MTARWMVALAFACGSMGLAGSISQAALSSQIDLGTLTSSRGNFVEARQYDIPNARVAAQLSAHQTVTAWQVTAGSWNGQALDGLILVMVKTTSDDGRAMDTTNCYISHLATPAQRKALLNAYVSTRPEILGDRPDENPASWRVEPAVIKFEVLGHSVILHIGTIA